jgi:hypothetical protein
MLTHDPQGMPTKFTAGIQIYSDAAHQNVMALCTDSRNLVTGSYTGPIYVVYPAKPLLHVDMIHPILQDQSPLVAGRNIIPFDPALAPTINTILPDHVNNPFG